MKGRESFEEMVMLGQLDTHKPKPESESKPKHHIFYKN